MKIKNITKISALVTCFIWMMFTFSLVKVSAAGPIIRFKSYDELKSAFFKIKEKNNKIFALDPNRPYMPNLPVPEVMPMEPPYFESNESSSVDDADFIKTDGNYIYFIKGDKLNITSTFNQTMSNINSIKINGEILGMHIANKKIILITRPEDLILDINANTLITIPQYNKRREEFFKDPNALEKAALFDNLYSFQKVVSVFFFDISNPKDVKQERVFKQAGSFKSSKLIGDNLYLITHTNDFNEYHYYSSKDEINLKSITPFIIDSADRLTLKFIQPKQISCFPNPMQYNFTIISGLNIKNAKKTATEACLGSSNIYNNDAYLGINTLYDLCYDDESKKTTIIKHTLTDANPKTSLIGVISGNYINKFSLDEYNGNLRIATELNGKHNIFVLSKSLNTIGKLQDLNLKNEVSYVRFMGEKAFIFSPMILNPIYGVDLKNLSSIQHTELINTGFTSYLNLYSNNLLFGLGRDKKINITQNTLDSINLKISLYDISNLNKIAESQKLIIGSYPSVSTALQDPKYLLYSKDKNIIGFPVSVQKSVPGFENEFSYSETVFAGYNVYSMDDKKGLILQTQISHVDDSSNNSLMDEDYRIRLSILSDNILYTISNKMIQAHSIEDFKLLGKLNLN